VTHCAACDPPPRRGLSTAQFRRSIEGLQDEWQGWTYDLLSRNCNHFCEALVEILGVGPLPAWVNRFAVNADYALETSQTALTEVKKMWKSSTDTLQNATGWIKDHLTIGATRALPVHSSCTPELTRPSGPSQTRRRSLNRSWLQVPPPLPRLRRAQRPRRTGKKTRRSHNEL
jgi:hypothetical protein